jgi:hypothetical protein
MMNEVKKEPFETLRLRKSRAFVHAGWGTSAAIAVFVSARASFSVALGCAAVAAGFATAAVKARIVDHTVLRATAYGVAVSGFVDSREERERSDRIVVRLAGMEGARLTLPQPSPTYRQAALAACEPSQRS